jgi:hypothetical protein
VWGRARQDTNDAASEADEFEGGAELVDVVTGLDDFVEDFDFDGAFLDD